MRFEFSNTEKLSPDFKGITEFLRKSIELQTIVNNIPPELRTFDIVHISFEDDTEMQLLNRLYRQLDKTTDVLSFEIQQESMLGELYISLSEVQKNSEYFKTSPVEELFDVIIHGILHLSGFEHSDTMFSIQHNIRDLMANEYETYRRTR